VGWFSKNNDFNQDDSERGRQSALNDGTPVTILYRSTTEDKVTVARDEDDQCLDIKQEDLAESKPRKGWW
jgi:hypothetical protein